MQGALQSSSQTHSPSFKLRVTKINFWKFSFLRLLFEVFVFLSFFAQEVLFPLFFLFWLILMSMMHPHRKYGEVANTNLGTLDTSMLVNFVIGYTPPTRMAREIMKKVAFDNFEDGIQNLSILFLSVYLMPWLVFEEGARCRCC